MWPIIDLCLQNCKITQLCHFKSLSSHCYGSNRLIPHATKEHSLRTTAFAGLLWPQFTLNHWFFHYTTQVQEGPLRMEVGVSIWREKGKLGRVEAWGGGAPYPESALWDDPKMGKWRGRLRALQDVVLIPVQGQRGGWRAGWECLSHSAVRKEFAGLKGIPRTHGAGQRTLVSPRNWPVLVSQGLEVGPLA